MFRGVTSKTLDYPNLLLCQTLVLVNAVLVQGVSKVSVQVSSKHVTDSSWDRSDKVSAEGEGDMMVMVTALDALWVEN